jgi:N6-adenosine-specific RNA methylase IME4
MNGNPIITVSFSRSRYTPPACARLKARESRSNPETRRLEMLRDDPPLAGHYGTILTDPPWKTIVWGPTGNDRCPDGPRKHYATMSWKELKALPVGSWGAKKDCRLFMWTTDAHLPQALALGEAWGFKYSTVAFTWAKRTSTGKCWQFAGGHATRKGTEQCLLFLRGNLNRRSASVRQLIVAPVREPGRKPDEAYERIEQLVDGPYLELFSRTTWPGWDAWGDEKDKFTACPAYALAAAPSASPDRPAADGAAQSRRRHVAPQDDPAARRCAPAQAAGPRWGYTGCSCT